MVSTGDNLSYQWYKDGTAPGNIVAGQTAPTLALNNVQASQAGSYYCVVTGSCGTVTSSFFVLTVSSTARIATDKPVTAELVQVRISSNPVVDWLQVEVSGLNRPAQVRLYDLQGRSHGEWVVEAVDGVGQLKANVSSLPLGIFILSLETPEGVLNRQWVLKHR